MRNPDKPDLTAWRRLLDQIPTVARARAVGRFHLLALERRSAIIREHRALADIARALEGFWIVTEACVAHLAGEVPSQQALAARAAGTVSPATISRAIADGEQQGWLTTHTDPNDARVRLVRPTAKALDYYLMRVSGGWDEIMGIFEEALASIPPDGRTEL